MITNIKKKIMRNKKIAKGLEKLRFFACEIKQKSLIRIVNKKVNGFCCVHTFIIQSCFNQQYSCLQIRIIISGPKKFTIFKLFQQLST